MEPKDLLHVLTILFIFVSAFVFVVNSNPVMGANLHTDPILENESRSITEFLDEEGKFSNPGGYSGAIELTGFSMIMNDGGAPVFMNNTGGEPNDRWYALGNGVNNTVYALAVSGDDLYVGGEFTSAGGVTAYRIARYNMETESWHALENDFSSPFQIVYALAMSGIYLYVGGDIYQVGSLWPNNIARYNMETGTWQVLGSGVNGTVRAFTVSGNDLYAGGLFTTAGGKTVNYIARYDMAENAGNASWHALGSGVDLSVTALAVSGTDLYAGGYFEEAGGKPASFIARYDMDEDEGNTSWHALGAGVGNTIRAMIVNENNLYVGGYFSTAGGSSASRIARYDMATETWHALGSGVNNTLRALAVSGNDLYAGGYFSTAGGSTANRIARYDIGEDAGDASWHTLGDGTNNTIFAIAVSGENLYTGGAFTSAGNKTASRIALYDMSIVNYYSKQSGNWNDAGTWSTEGCGGEAAAEAPGEYDAVVICDGHIVSIETTVSNNESVVVQSGGELQITSSGVLEITSSGSISSSGDIKVLSSGMFCNFGNTATDLSFYRNLYGGEGWRYLSSPVSGSYGDLLSGSIWTQGAIGADYTGGSPNIFTWTDELESDVPDVLRGRWVEVTNLNEPLPSGHGALVYVYQSDFDGGNDGFPKTLLVTGEEHGIVNPAMNPTASGWSFMGNPYGCAISYAGLTQSNLTPSVYVWDANDDEGEGGGDPQNPSGSWRVYNTSTTDGDLKGGVIKPFQAFFVQNSSTAASVEFDNNAKTTDIGEALFLGKQPAAPVVVRLQLSGENMLNSAWLRFSENGSLGHNAGDAWQLQPMSVDYAMIASAKPDGMMDLAHFPEPSDEMAIPLFVEATRPGIYTINATDVHIPAGIKFYLNDLQKGVSLKIDEGLQYAFMMDNTAAKQKKVDPFEWMQNRNFKAKAAAETRFIITAYKGIDFVQETPQEIALHQNYPNPFNPSTVIKFELPESGEVRLELFDLIGRHITTLVDGIVQAGVHQVTFDAASLPSGVYIYRMLSGDQQIIRKMTLVK